MIDDQKVPDRNHALNVIAADLSDLYGWLKLSTRYAAAHEALAVVERELGLPVGEDLFPRRGPAAPPPKVHRNWPCPVCGLSPDEVCSCEQLGLKPAPQPPPSVPAGADVAEVLAGLLRTVSVGRLEYATNAPEHTAEILRTEANAYENAARIVEGDEHMVRALLPSWRWPERQDGTGARSAGGGGCEYCDMWHRCTPGGRCRNCGCEGCEPAAAEPTSELLPVAPSSAATSGAPPARVWWSDELGWIWGFDGRYEADDWSSRWQIAELPSDAVELAAAPPTPSAPGVAELLAACDRAEGDPLAYAALTTDYIRRLLAPAGADGGNET